MSTDLYQARISAPEPGRPLVFAFHGTGGNEDQFFELSQHLVPGGGVVSPRGDVSEMGAARFFRRTGEGVYDMDDLARATTKMTAFVEAHKDANPGSAVYAFGYSNGANILAAAFLEHPELFDRVGLLHPLVTWDAVPNPELTGRKVLITAGRRDPITPWPMSEQLIDWFSSAGADVSTEVHAGGHELQNTEIDALVQLFRD